MLVPLLAGLTAFGISYAFLPFVISFSKRKQIVSSPGRRRVHKVITPSLGGAAIFFGFAVACMSWGAVANYSKILPLLSIMIVPFIVGLLDDLIELTPTAKLTGQLVTATLIFFILEVRITSLYGLFSDKELPYLLSYAVTVIAVLAITNSLNLIDGIDGLAGTLSLMVTSCFGVWFFLTGSSAFATVAFALGGGILAFLMQNWEPSKIFMGDTGSFVIGVLLSIMAISFMQSNLLLPSGHALKFNSSIGAVAAVLIVPLIDTSRVIFLRLYNGLPVFKADKRHIHHALLRLGLRHRQIVYVLSIINVFFIGLAVLTRRVPEEYVIVGIVLISLTGCMIMERLLHKYSKRN